MSRKTDPSRLRAGHVYAGGLSAQAIETIAARAARTPGDLARFLERSECAALAGDEIVRRATLGNRPALAPDQVSAADAARVLAVEKMRERWPGMRAERRGGRWVVAR
jgi:hypothetical protein